MLVDVHGTCKAAGLVAMHKGDDSLSWDCFLLLFRGTASIKDKGCPGNMAPAKPRSCSALRVATLTEAHEQVAVHPLIRICYLTAPKEAGQSSQRVAAAHPAISVKSVQMRLATRNSLVDDELMIDRMMPCAAAGLRPSGPAWAASWHPRTPHQSSSPPLPPRIRQAGTGVVLPAAPLPLPLRRLQWLLLLPRPLPPPAPAPPGACGSLQRRRPAAAGCGPEGAGRERNGGARARGGGGRVTGRRGQGG